MKKLDHILQIQVSNKMDDTARKSIVDPTIIKECSAESLKTVMEICLRCLSNEPADRPSIEDVLWTLQFAAQLQDPWRADSQPHTSAKSNTVFRNLAFDFDV